MLRKTIAAGFVTGGLLVGSAWAGVGLVPVSTSTGDGSTSSGDRPAGAPAAEAPSAATLRQALSTADGPELGADEALVGAAKVNLFPRPDASKGEVWVKDKAKCVPVGSQPDPQGIRDHAADWRTPWIENTNCLYMGGFGVGPSQPILEFDEEYGLWARTVAVSRGGKWLVLTIVDAEGYNAVYNKLCPPEKACGALDIADQMGEELGLDPAGVVIASTHAHSAMDLIGGWGAVPTWYMRQVADAIRQSIRDAVRTAEPAVIEAGDVVARANNAERRDTYYSAEDQTLNWFRAIGRDGDTIATVGTFAAHATSFGGSATKAHADWPGVFAETVEDRFGGIGLMFEAGLGNMSTRGGANMGKALAALVPEVGKGIPVHAPNVRVAQESWNQPVTNLPLGSLGAAGFFDRPFTPGPAVVEVAKGNSQKKCRSSSATGVQTQVTAAKIGDLVVTAAPGEIFANFSNTIEERSPITALSIGQANDALGYMPQSFETDYAAREGLGFAGGGVFEYEDAYSIDHCFGDVALVTTLRLLNDLK